MLSDLTSLDAYLQEYGRLLGQRAREAMAPLHVPSRDRAVVAPLLRKPFDAQAHLIAAGVKALRRQKMFGVSAECGVGKTICGIGIAHTHAAGRYYRGLVFCPPHLTGKWARELHDTVPDVHTRIIDSYRDLIELRQRKKPDRPEWWITSNNKAKLGSPWRASFLTKRRGDQEGLPFCPACMKLCVEEDKGEGRLVPVPIADLHKSRHSCYECKQPLWTYTNEIDRWPAADYVHDHLRGVFRYLIVDEAHEEKSATTARANAMGALAASCRYVIPMTGTLIGGYAEHLRPTLFRLSPRSLVEEGFSWENHMPFNEAYGRIETKIVEKESTGGRDNRYSKGSSRTKTRYVRPGVMPTLFGRHLIQNFSFLSLDEVAENLPELAEEVIPVSLDAEQALAYDAIQQPLMDAVKEMVRKGDKRLLGMMLQVLLCYPDLPFGWPEIGYHDTEPDGSRYYVPVVKPDDLDPNIVRPKERALVKACLERRAAGRQTWIFTTMTDKRDVCDRLRCQLEAAGLRTMVLRANVETKKREAWIAKHGPTVDVVLSHPQLVETGLDLFDKGGAFNFSTLIFYLTGYNLFTLRQASRRAWRVGQRERCEVLYFYYAGTMQERAMELMGKKLAAAEAIEGKFSAEGLAAMAGEESSAEMALARSLINRLDRDESSIRAWNRVVQRGTRLESSQSMVMEQAIVREDLQPIVVPPKKKMVIVSSGKKPAAPEAPRKLAQIVSTKRTPRPMPGTIIQAQRELFAEAGK